jgi:L-lactate dehydrogenase complex protein LldG
VTDRATFLGRIRTEMRKSPGLFAASTAPRPARPGLIVETLRRELGERWRETLERFRSEFERVGGVYHRVTSAAEVPDVILRIAREREARAAIAWHPSALGADWREALTAAGLATEAMPPAGVEPAAERRALRDRIAAADLGVTGADLAVAETGSLILLSGGGRPRSTSLLPPYHVAVFDRAALVESLAQVGVFLEAWHDGEPAAWRGGAINVITGPSRTADIELTLTRGVHGPKEVHAVFVEGGLRG